MNRRRISRHFPDPAEETPKCRRLRPIPTGGQATRRVCTASSTTPPPAVLPQAAQRLDARRELWPDEVRVRVETLNLDAASFRQLEGKHTVDGRADGDAVRREVLAIVAERGKMQNPVTGSGGMLIGTVEEVGPESTLGLEVGDHVATLVSLSLTPLVIDDGLERWDGHSEQVPADGYAILFGRSIAATIPDDLPPGLSLAVMDVCGAPALTRRLVARYVYDRPGAVGRRDRGRRQVGVAEPGRRGRRRVPADDRRGAERRRGCPAPRQRARRRRGRGRRP